MLRQFYQGRSEIRLQGAASSSPSVTEKGKIHCYSSVAFQWKTQEGERIALQLLASLTFSHRIVQMLVSKGCCLKGLPTGILNKLQWEKYSIKMHLKGQLGH